MSYGAIALGFVGLNTVVMHGAESGRTGTDLSSVVWTSPSSGTIQIAGGAWVSKLFNRPMVWEIFRNGSLLTMGVMTQGDPYSKDNPFNFAAGSAGGSALNLAVQPGDTIALQIRRQSSATASTFVGLNLQLSLTAVPEPSGLISAALGLAALAGYAGWRQRRIRRQTCG
jgi:MYXO-CTERM domain-containing protein